MDHKLHTLLRLQLSLSLLAKYLNLPGIVIGSCACFIFLITMISCYCRRSQARQLRRIGAVSFSPSTPERPQSGMPLTQ